MRKKDLRARNDMLRRELADANQLAAMQVKRLNEPRMEITFLERDREIAADHNGHASNGASPSPAQEPDLKPCPDCAESVRSAARKYRYCGYRFDGVERAWSSHQAQDGGSNGSASVARLGTVSGS